MPEGQSRAQNIGLALQAFGAGMSGTMPQFQQVQNQKQQLAQQEQRYQQQQQMVQEDRQIAADDRNSAQQLQVAKFGANVAKSALELAKTGEWEKAVQLSTQTTQQMAQLGLPVEGSQQMSLLFAAAKNGSEEAGQLAINQLETAVSMGENMGWIEKADAASPAGKSQQDVDEGFITDEEHQAQITALNRETVGRQQIGGRITVKDEDDRLFSSGQGFDPNTGEAAQILTAVDGRGGKPRGSVVRVTTTGLTAAQAVEQAQALAGAGARGSGVEGRIQSSIDNGLVAAESTSILRRSLELLQDVETGGLDGWMLRVQGFLGTTSGDEGELIGSLGKAVLSQLRDTFGAAFTEGEGRRLERIEANIGANRVTNRRLLNQALTLAERSAERGIKAAEESGDQRAADDMMDLLDFRITDDGGISIQTIDGDGNRASFEPVPSDEEEGAIAIGPNGVQIITKDGMWIAK
jgi:hypothetical protein